MHNFVILFVQVIHYETNVTMVLIWETVEDQLHQSRKTKLAIAVPISNRRKRKTICYADIMIKKVSWSCESFVMRLNVLRLVDAS